MEESILKTSKGGYNISGYIENKKQGITELKHRMTLVEIAVITFLLAILCQLAVIGLAAASGGTGILARLVKSWGVENCRATRKREAVLNQCFITIMVLSAFCSVK